MILIQIEIHELPNGMLDIKAEAFDGPSIGMGPVTRMEQQVSAWVQWVVDGKGALNYNISNVTAEGRVA